jgi:hypothetical protein
MVGKLSFDETVGSAKLAHTSSQTLRKPADVRKRMFATPVRMVRGIIGAACSNPQLNIVFSRKRLVNPTARASGIMNCTVSYALLIDLKFPVSRRGEAFLISLPR